MRLTPVRYQVRGHAGGIPVSGPGSGAATFINLWIWHQVRRRVQDRIYQALRFGREGGNP